MRKLSLLILFLFGFIFSFLGQTNRIKLQGIVTSKNGTPIIGVAIHLIGEPNSTTTQICGDFEISIPENYNGALSLSCFNARPYELKLEQLKDKESIIISLEFIEKYKNKSCSKTYRKEKRIKIT